jgi:prepilin-type N-terminal cleavage/methylation domain-containing protein
MKSNLTKQRGFTLVEMAIVVVLGGILLAAGLAGGRGLISRAQTQDVLQTIGDLQSAATGFKQRYGCLPGDLASATTLLPAPGNVNGTGGTLCNGLIEGAITAAGSATAANEVGVAPLQLYAAGLIGKTGSTATMRIQSQFGPVHMASAAIRSPVYALANPTVANVIVLFNLPCEVALEVDRAIDDGNLAAGRAMGEAACAAGGNQAIYSVPLQ